MTEQHEIVTITLDNVTKMMVDAWREHQEKKPDIPGEYAIHVDHLRLQMDEWQRSNEALRAVVSSRLAAIALENRKKRK